MFPHGDTQADSTNCLVRIINAQVAVPPTASSSATASPTATATPSSSAIVYVTTLAGNTSGTVGVDNSGYADGVGTAASFRQPYGICVLDAGPFAFVVRYKRCMRTT